MNFVWHLALHLDIQVLIVLMVVELAVTHYVGLRVVCKVMLGDSHRLKRL